MLYKSALKRQIVAITDDFAIPKLPIWMQDGQTKTELIKISTAGPSPHVAGGAEAVPAAAGREGAGIRAAVGRGVADDAGQRDVVLLLPQPTAATHQLRYINSLGPETPLKYYSAGGDLAKVVKYKAEAAV